MEGLGLYHGYTFYFLRASNIQYSPNTSLIQYICTENVLFVAMP